MATNFMSVETLGIGSENLTLGILTVGAICVLMLVANTLRRKIPFLRRSLLPTAVIAGLLGLVIKETINAIFGINIFSIATLQGLVFHLLSIGFIALCLRDKDDYAYDVDKSKVKIERVKAFKSGGVIVGSYLMQGIIGLIITAIIGTYLIADLNNATGLILPMAFGQGPNQANNLGGNIWDAAGVFAAFGEGSGRNFGITVAAFGFLWASIPGVIIVNRLARKSGKKLERNEYPKAGDTPPQNVEEANEIPLSESIDKFTLQICMVGAIYLVTIGILAGVEALLTLSGIPFLIDQIPTIWGFSFMMSVVVAMLAKKIMKTLFRKGVMHRKYPNSYMMNRISGAAFDISITAALSIISVTALGILWVPVIVITTVGGICTIFFCRFICNRVYKDYKDEGFLGMYGMMTGTISNGMILIREIDNEFKTPAADDLVVGSSAAIILGLPLLLLISIAHKGMNNWLWVLLIITGYFIGLMAYLLDVHKLIFKRRIPIAVGAPDEGIDPSNEAASDSFVSADEDTVALSDEE